MELQRSQYITVERGVERLRKKPVEVNTDNGRDLLVEKMRGQDLNLRFCRPDEVNNKRKNIMMFKMRFLARV